MVVSEIVAATFIYVCGLRRAYRIILRGEKKLRNYLPLQTKSGAYYSLQRRFLRRVFKAIHSAIQYTQNWKRNRAVTSNYPDSRKETRLSQHHGQDGGSLSTKTSTSGWKTSQNDVRRGLQGGLTEEPNSNNSYVRLQVKREDTKAKARSDSDEPESRAL